MIHRPACVGIFEFAVLASLRATQLVRGCVPRVEEGHTVAVTAQREVAEGKVTALASPEVPTSVSAEIVTVAAPDLGEATTPQLRRRPIAP